MKTSKIDAQNWINRWKEKLQLILTFLGIISMFGIFTGLLEILCQSDRITYSKGRTHERDVRFK